MHWILRNRSLLPQGRVLEVEGRTVLLRRDTDGTAMALLISQPWRLLPAADPGDTDNLLLPPAGGPLELTVVMGFGSSDAQAIGQALASLKADPAALERAATAAWHRYARGLDPAVRRDPASLLAPPGAPPTRLSTPMAITWCGRGIWCIPPRACSRPATVGEPSAPPISVSKPDAATGLQPAPRESRPFPQNAFLNGQPHWNATQLDKTALPLLLAWHLDRQDPWPQVKLAAD